MLTPCAPAFKRQEPRKFLTVIISGIKTIPKKVEKQKRHAAKKREINSWSSKIFLSIDALSCSQSVLPSLAASPLLCPSS
jgi:hypothetical protein